MKTTSWTPPANIAEVSTDLDETVIFVQADAKFEKSGALLSALLAGAAYASADLQFQILGNSREELVRFTPGTPVQGVPSLCRALLEIAMHLDKHVRDAVVKRETEIREYVMAEFDAAVWKAAAELRAREAAGEAPATGDAPATRDAPPVAEPGPAASGNPPAQ